MSVLPRTAAGGKHVVSPGEPWDQEWRRAVRNRDEGPASRKASFPADFPVRGPGPRGGGIHLAPFND
jgi:hypothetical protein